MDATIFGLAVAVSFVATGCSGPRPPAFPDFPPEPDEPAADGRSEIAREVHRLLDSERAQDAEGLVRAELSSEESHENAANLRLLLGETLEAQNRFPEASIAYSSVAGQEGGEELHASAWDGISRLRSQLGDERGAVRAKMRAWDLDGRKSRLARVTELRDTIGFLPTNEVRALEWETRGFASHSILREVLSDRAWEANDGEVVVSVLAPFTGRFEEFGDAFREGVQLALEDRDRELPASAPIVRLRHRDTEGNVLRAAREARAAIFEDGCVSILGPLLSVTSVSAGSVAQSYGIPLLAPTATDPDLPRLGPMVLTFDPSPRDLAYPLADFSVNGLGNIRHGVLLANDGINDQLEQEFRDAVEMFGGRVVVSVAYDPDEKDFRRLIERIDEANVDAVYIPGGAANLEALAPQLEFYEFQRRILGNGGWTHPKILDGGNHALEGAVLSVETADYPDSEFMLRLGQEVTRRTGQELSRFHVRGYQAMMAFLAALDQGARLGEEIAEVIRLRRHWDTQPWGEQIHVLTYRDGSLGPASWARGFDLKPRRALESDPEPEPPSEEPDPPGERPGL